MSMIRTTRPIARIAMPPGTIRKKSSQREDRLKNSATRGKATIKVRSNNRAGRRNGRDAPHARDKGTATSAPANAQGLSNQNIKAANSKTPASAPTPMSHQRDRKQYASSPAAGTIKMTPFQRTGRG